MTLPCIACGKELKSAVPEKVNRGQNQPYKGTAFLTSGHYGSTFFDSFDGKVIEINVCDDCLRAKPECIRGPYAREFP